MKRQYAKQYPHCHPKNIWKQHKKILIPKWPRNLSLRGCWLYENFISSEIRFFLSLYYWDYPKWAHKSKWKVISGSLDGMSSWKNSDEMILLRIPEVTFILIYVSWNDFHPKWIHNGLQDWNLKINYILDSPRPLLEPRGKSHLKQNFPIQKRLFLRHFKECYTFSAKQSIYCSNTLEKKFLFYPFSSHVRASGLNQ